MSPRRTTYVLYVGMFLVLVNSLAAQPRPSAASAASGRAERQCPATDSTNDARQMLATYKDRLARRDYAGTFCLMSRGAVAYYARMQAVALRAHRAEVEGLPFPDRMMVLTMRASHGRALRRLTTRQVVEKFGRASVEALHDTILRYTHTVGDTAYAIFVNQFVPIKFAFAFRERGGWRFDFTEVLAWGGQSAEAEFQGYARARGKTLNAFLDLAIEELRRTNGNARFDFWEPPPP